MKTVILAGGLGTRISEESHLRPKPMIEIGGQPILWHIMKMPDADAMNGRIAALKSQLSIFANQRILLHLRRQKRMLERYQACERKAGELVAHLEVLAQLDRPGRLSAENRRRLTACGAKVADRRELDSVMEKDVVTNFHVSQVLTIRRELLETLSGGNIPSGPSVRKD